jgi:twitching motility protein PilT
MCQSLLPRADNKGRAMCMEILVPNAAVRNLIREDKIHQIYSAMQSGQEKYGMQTFNQSLASAYFQKQITLEMAISRSSNQDELQEMIARGATFVNRSGYGSTAKGAAPASGDSTCQVSGLRFLVRPRC